MNRLYAFPAIQSKKSWWQIMLHENLLIWKLNCYSEVIWQKENSRFLLCEGSTRFRLFQQTENCFEFQYFQMGKQTIDLSKIKTWIELWMSHTFPISKLKVEFESLIWNTVSFQWQILTQVTDLNDWDQSANQFRITNFERGLFRIAPDEICRKTYFWNLFSV